ncbi:zinc-binding dehydrogenase [Verticiella sediminum]|uniref:Zinc-binding dehydrogenase n=1 Tax=Verticiella sediminum TaxID=1247510 RepID=A0A556AMV5_9BURK|nr:zinc-binding dehydrogenase [Verticiella sediminum]TSH94223.1 zinc-binding dehydrogenase [Verticiella sediminum]
MKAQVIRSHGDLDQITFEENWPTPTPGDGEVVIRVGACALNYHDLFTLHGMPGIKVPMPIIMGIDMAGTVSAVGPNAGDWKEGDRVLADPLTREGRYALLGETVDGGLAEYCKVPAEQLIRLPGNVGFDKAAALPVAYGTAYRMMVTRGGLPLDGSWAGRKVFILGASGGVGTCCVQLAKLSGAEVIVAASSQEKLDKLAALGADHGIDYKADDFMKALHGIAGKPRITGEGGVDMIINFTGGDTWVPSIKSLKKGGSLLTCGATAGFDPKTDLRYIWTFELNILGSNGWMREDLHALLELVQQGRLDPPVEMSYPLEKAADAFRALEDRTAFGKLVILP